MSVAWTMPIAGCRIRTCAALILPLILGCQTTPGPIFPEVSPPIVWPPPPDAPRIRYIGELRGQASLGLPPSGWEAVEAALTGPRPQVAFSRPTAVAVHGERVYIADSGLGVVHLLDLETRQYQAIRGARPDPLRVPIDVAVAENQLLVVDRGRATVDVLDWNGACHASKSWSDLKAPISITWDATNQRYWLADVAAHACFASSDLRAWPERIGERGSAPGQFNYPTAVTWHSAVGLVVADAMNFRVQVFHEPGSPVTVFGQKGDAAGDFARPRDVAVDSDGHIYVLDNQFENVQIFDRDGHLLMSFGQEGVRPGEFSLPSGITIDAHDRIWVADSSNHRVQVFQYLPQSTP